MGKMRRKYLYLVFVLIIVVCGVVGEECPPGISNNGSSTCGLNPTGNKDASSEKKTTPQVQEIMTNTPEPMSQPKALNMLAEDHDDSVFHPTPLPLTNKTKIGNSTEEPKGRALNFTVDEQTTGNVLSVNGSHDAFGDLSDVSITDSDEDMQHPIVSAKILAPKGAPINSTLDSCEKGGLTYDEGEKLENGCDSVCTCTNGSMDCVDRCSGPYFRKGKKIDDPLCTAKEADDPCCSVLVCSGDTETEPLEICRFANKTYNRGEHFNKNCSETCTCEAAGQIFCKPRCPSTNKTSDRCVEVPDPNDSCCKKVLCDVTLDDHEPDKEEDKSKIKILSAKFLNSTTIALKFDSKFDNDTLPIIDVSEDKKNWNSYQSSSAGILFINTSAAKYLKLDNSDDVIDIQNADFPPKQAEKIKSSSDGCSYKGKTYKHGEEYNDNCEALCVCKNSEMKCLKLQCPTYFGVDVLDPNCVEWETVPADFKPIAPNCCAEEIRCKHNGSCIYQDKMYKNYEHIPLNVTGCEKRCYCEMGEVECQNACPPVPALPPSDLSCPPDRAVLDHIMDDDCCMYWICDTQHPDNEETKRNQTEIDTNNINKTDSSYSGPFSTKSTSKILGPLLVYQNENEDNSHHKPNITTDENPFYNKSKNPLKTNETKSNVVPTPKPSKTVQKQKPNKNAPPFFVTPPPINQNPFNPNTSDKKQIQIHSKGNPEDILQFIHQHPEITNYPEGSVLEIHNIKQPVPPFAPPNRIPANGRPNMIPYIVAPDHLNNNDLPPGITLEQILQEIHKNTHSPQQHPMHPFAPPHSPFLNNEHLFTQESGPNKSVGGFQGNFQQGFPQSQDEVNVNTLLAMDAHTVRLAFIIPSLIVGLHGQVEVRYTHESNDDVNSWQLQVFAPPDDLIATPQLEFELRDLIPDTEYRIKITIRLRDVNNKPTSRIYKVRTLKDQMLTTPPPMIPIEPDLAITDINATWVTVAWRKFTEYEMPLIDGVQLRFKEIDGKIYAATPLIHRAVTSYTLENLKPNTKYEIGIFFIPFPGQLTELHAENMLHFTTANEVDTYGFNVSLDISLIKSTSVEITWSGVPYPEDKYVNIYRAIYQSDSGKEDHNTFKIAKRDSPTKTVIMDLKPGTRYRLWLEVYLTNGKIKTSNVQDFSTKPRAAPSLGASSQQDKLSRSEEVEMKGDYYGPLVIVAILAAIAILSTLILLLILVRRHNQNKAAITPPSSRVSQSAYDNPTYKVEIQQETMGL